MMQSLGDHMSGFIVTEQVKCHEKKKRGGINLFYAHYY